MTGIRGGRVDRKGDMSRLEEVAAMRTMEDIVNHLRAEYLEMPGLRLKTNQVQRLCGIEQAMCQLVIDALVESNFLCLKPDGAYARVTDGADRPRPKPVKAHLETGTRPARAS